MDEQLKADIEEFFAERFKVFFENKTGQNLTNYNMAFLKSKIKEKLKDQNISSFREFFEKMIINQHIDSELDDLFYIIINRESDFFRYSDQFVYFRDHVLPELYHTCQKENRCLIKILCIGIALGQEPYSIAMILEDMKDMYPGLMISIEANEMVQKNIDFARDGVYDPNLLRYFNRYDDYLFKEFFDKYFIPVNGKDGSYEINNAIRQRVNYRKMNVIFDDLSDEYDIIFCRNVIIYFYQKDQNKVLKKIYKHLSPDGYLFLGHSEFPQGLRDNMKSVFHHNSVIYRKNV